MIKHYLKISFRNLWKYKSFSAINIAGLAIGMAACLMILQYVSFEFSYDQFHENKKNIFRVVNDRYQDGKLTQHSTRTYSAIGKAMQEDYPNEIIQYARVTPFYDRIIQYNDKKTEEQGLATDNSFLTMFSIPMLAGNRADALSEPNTMILSEKLARKLSEADKDPRSLIGRMLMLENDSLPYEVTGICKDVPENSHLQFDFLVSYISLYRGGNAYWRRADYSFTESDFWQYIQLRPGADYKTLQKKFASFSQRHFRGNKVSGSDEVFSLQPLVKAHLYSDFEYEIGKTGNATIVWGLLIIALFTIVIAWVNYINLSTARSIERAREVGVRKAVGALQSQLIRQFLSESLVVNLAALLVAVLLVYLAQPSFNRLLGYELSLQFLFDRSLNGYGVVALLVILIIAGIIIAGIYPALVLSSFKPIAVVKGRLSNQGKGMLLRKTFVVGQFAITVCLIIGSLVIYRQVRFMNNKQLGLTIDQMLIIKPPSLGSVPDSIFFSRLNSFKEEIKQLTYVKGATGSNRVPGMSLSKAFDVHRADDNSGNYHTIDNWGVNHDFINVYEIKMIAGRAFSLTDFNLDWNKNHATVLTESAVQMLGFASPESAVGKKIVMRNKKWDIIGVTTNFHHKSLHHVAEPVLFMPSYGPNNNLSVKISPTNLSKSIVAIREKYEAFFPGNLFDYYFLDEKFNEQYKNDRLFGNVFGLFSALAIFIACLGLFGLSLYAVNQRTREIGIRKVVGASVTTIVLLLCRDFIKLVLLASLLAFPVAWWIMNKWLEDFSYRINISWGIFLLAGAAALFVSLLTISFQAIKAAISNPVKSLRTE